MDSARAWPQSIRRRKPMPPLGATFIRQPSYPFSGPVLSRRSASPAVTAAASDAARGSVAHAGTSETGAPGARASEASTGAASTAVVKISTLTSRRTLVGIRAAGNYETRGADCEQAEVFDYVFHCVFI